MEIAGKLTIQQWNELKANLDSKKQENWSLAYHFFEERLRTRYLKPINTILEMGDNSGEGFAVVSLQCSLIETIECFINGWLYNAVGDKLKKTISNRWYCKKIEKNNIVTINCKNLKNVDIFISFFKEREPFNKYKVKGEMFFWNVRCGLLHETQTKNGWKIWADGFGESINNKTIYRNNFQNDIEKVIENYKNSIINGVAFDGISTCELRENFISKFNHICNES